MPLALPEQLLSFLEFTGKERPIALKRDGICEQVFTCSYTYFSVGGLTLG